MADRRLPSGQSWQPGAMRLVSPPARDLFSYASVVSQRHHYKQVRGHAFLTGVGDERVPPA